MKIAANFKRFGKEEDGTAAILWAISLVAILGLVAVGWEVGKMGRTQAELQTFVDSVALAAAGELDGNADAITRATSAANNLISDRNTFGIGNDGNRALNSADFLPLVFLNNLPADDQTPIGASIITTNARNAAFVEITARPHTVAMSFLRVLNGLLGRPLGADPRISATAVAGYTGAACDTTPLMFCLPGTDIDVGDMINLRDKGGSSLWAAGNFGFLDVTKFADASFCTGSGAPLLRCMLAARENITRCALSRSGADTDPGQSVGITTAAFNVRFDLYHGPTQSWKNLDIYAPAPNIIRGMEASGNGCSPNQLSPSTDTIALPRDNDLVANPDLRFGNGQWDRDGYLDVNHDLADGIDDDSGSDAHLPPLPLGAALPGSRYAMYLREILHSQDAINNPNAPDILDSSLSETGIPQCATSTPAGPSRRVVVAAGIDCSANPIAGRTLNIPVEQYYEVFLTEQVGTQSEFAIVGEVIGIPDANGIGGSGATGIFRDLVQLYR